MIKTVNCYPKISESKKRKARAKFWKRESKALRKRYRKKLMGASILFISLVVSYAALCFGIYKIFEALGMSEELLAFFAFSAFAVGYALASLLNLGGKHLALLLYRSKRSAKREKITVGEMFCAFGDKIKREKSKRLLASALKRFTKFLIVFLIVLWVFLIFKPNVFYSLAILFFTIFICLKISVKGSLEWVFEFFHNESGQKSTINSKKLGNYAVSNKEKDFFKMSFAKLIKFAELIILPVFGLILFLPYAWTTEAVSAECISSELVIPSAEN